MGSGRVHATAAYSSLWATLTVLIVAHGVEAWGTLAVDESGGSLDQSASIGRAGFAEGRGVARSVGSNWT